MKWEPITRRNCCAVAHCSATLRHYHEYRQSTPGRFGGFIGVINGKSELYAYIDDHEGMLFVNTSNPLLAKLSANIHRFTYGEESNTQLYGELIAADPFLTFVFEYQTGRHLLKQN